MKDGLTRAEKLLAMILVYLMGDAQKNAKARALSNAGLSNKEIAGLLDTTVGAIGLYLYELRQVKRPKASKKK